MRKVAGLNGTRHSGAAARALAPQAFEKRSIVEPMPGSAVGFGRKVKMY
jgi:hypothetical protein